MAQSGLNKLEGDDSAIANGSLCVVPSSERITSPSTYRCALERYGLLIHTLLQESLLANI